MRILGQWLPLIKIVVVFLVMLTGIRLKLGIALSILLGAVAQGLLFTVAPGSWLSAAWLGLSGEKTLYLAAIVGLILLLSDLLEASGQNRRLMDAVTGRIASPRLRLFFFPALIGLLPMPGGAVFSAPMVQGVAQGMGIPGRDKVIVNYWFRHVWELAWPLYPGIILTSALAGVPLAQLVGVLLPAPLVCITLGWWFYLRPGVLPITEAPRTDAGGAAHKAPASAILMAGLPLILAIGGAVGLEGALSVFAPGVDFEWGVIVGLAAGVAAVAAQNRIGPRPFLKSLCRKGLRSMLLVIFAVFVFKEVLQASGAVDELAALAGGAAALTFTAVFLPFLVGLIAGINVAFVGAAFPLMLGLIAELGMQDQTLAYVVLGQFSGFAGIMASPIHICFLLTCQYFQVELAKAWRRLLPACACLMAFGAAYFALLRWVL